MTPEMLDLDAAFRESQIGEVLDGLERELIGLAPVKSRIRDIAASRRSFSGGITVSTRKAHQYRSPSGRSTAYELVVYWRFRPPTSRRSNEKPGSLSGRFTMKESRSDSRPCDESNALTLM